MPAMALKILIIPDKFKGTLTAHAAAAAIAGGWSESRPHDALELLPMSDGGDGFGAVLSRLLTVTEQTVLTVDAAQRPRQANWASFGDARSMGGAFFDTRGEPVAAGLQLEHHDRTGPPTTHVTAPELLVAVDVQNYLLGPTGAARVYGPSR